MREVRVVIRADGNATIGAGHLMRCLTVADAMVQLLQNRADILFLCADELSAEVAKKRGFQTEVLYTDYRHMETELPVWKSLFSTSHLTILVDSYYVTDKYLEGLSQYGRTYLMDDMQNRRFPVNAIINYNAFASSEIYDALYKGRVVELYLGSSYIPLREQFRQYKYTMMSEVKHVLITTGGSDKDNITEKILEYIYREGYEYHLVVGSFSPFLDELKFLEKTKKGITVHHDVQNMAELMGQCDLAVTAGGTTIYELASLGVPIICFSYAENQEEVVKYVGEKSIAGEAGAFHKNPDQTLQNIRNMFDDLCNDRRTREKYYTKERELVDGNGAMRLAKVLTQKKI